MSLLLDAAIAWNALHNVSYKFDIARKGGLKQIELCFCDRDFPHLAGMQYAKDVDFGIRGFEYYGEKLIPALLTKRLDDTKIESSRNWNKISGRLTAIINLQNTFDNEFRIFSFSNTKVRRHSQIDAKFLIKNMISDDIYFVFLDERSGRYYCKSAFRKDLIDYAENQSGMTLLQKVKTVDGMESILFIKDGYIPE